MDLALKGNRVLITGSSRGIGLGIANGFAQEGARVWLTGRDASALDLAGKDVIASGATEVQKSVGDLTDITTHQRLAEAIKQKWSALDILVLNLGSGRSERGLEVDREEWTRVLDLNLTSAFDSIRLLHPLLAKGQKPAVVFIGSIAGLEAMGAPLAYGAAKAALLQLMKECSRLLAEDGIRVNMVAPGNIFFEGGTWDDKMKADRKGVEAMLQSAVPLRRLGTVEEIASSVVFLSSERASFITGSCLVIDGGQIHSA